MKAGNLWAKKSVDGEGAWLPLPVHLADCAAVAGYIWDNWLAAGARCAIANGCGKVEESKARETGGVNFQHALPPRRSAAHVRDALRWRGRILAYYAAAPRPGGGEDKKRVS